MATFGQIPSNISFSKMHIVADLTERDALTGLTHGDRCMVTGLGQSGIEFFFDGTAWQAVSGQIIETQKVALGNTAANIDFLNIPDVFKDLLIIGHLRSTHAATTDEVAVRMNNDSTAGVYNSHGIESAGTTIQNQSDVGTDKMITGVCPAANQLSSTHSSYRLWVPDYTDNNERQVCEYFGSSLTTSAANSWTRHGSGLYESAPTISQITLLSSGGGNWDQSSYATLYGH